MGLRSAKGSAVLISRCFGADADHGYPEEQSSPLASAFFKRRTN
jgi:hypothetical protein